MPAFSSVPGLAARDLRAVAVPGGFTLSFDVVGRPGRFRLAGVHSLAALAGLRALGSSRLGFGPSVVVPE